MEINNLIEITKTIVKRRTRRADSQFETDILHTFLKCQEGLSAVTLMNKENIQVLWENFRASEKVTKFLLDGAAELFFLSGLNDKEWSAVLDNLAYALSIETSEYVRSADIGNMCVVDDTIRERVAGVSTIRRLLGDNKWLVFVVCMTMCPIIYRAKLNPEDYKEEGEEEVS